MSDLTAEMLRKLISYDPEAGMFTRKLPTRGVRFGANAGCLRHDGYITLWLCGRGYLAHRLAWFFVHGEWPPHELDHINGIKYDNRWVNIRPATRSENGMNKVCRRDNMAGLKGVAKNGPGWSARISRDKKRIYLGTYPTPEEASATYSAAARELHGEFAPREAA